MSDTDYTPTTEDVRLLWWIQFYEGIADDVAKEDAGWDDDRMYAQFDRWLAAHDAQVAADARNAFAALFGNWVAGGKLLREESD